MRLQPKSLTTSVSIYQGVRHPLLIRHKAPSSSRCRDFTHAAAMRATTRAPVTDKSRILEKPARFNPPSHGSRLPRRAPRSYPGPPLSSAEKEAQKTKQYPNMMPPEGTFMYNFLTDRRLHLWITLSTLTILAVFAGTQSFLHNTEFRDQLPQGSDFLYHPFQSMGQTYHVYKLHKQHESAKVSARRRQKREDADKRREFLKQHGVEPGFLTGTWMDRFGTIEKDEASQLVTAPEGQTAENPDLEPQDRPKRKKPKRWFGIWE